MFSIRPLEKDDAGVIAAAFADIGWKKPASQYLGYYREQQLGERNVLVALLDGGFAGYLTVKWKSGYGPFALAGVPEIQDLNVLPRYRKRGIATLLMDRAEAVVAERTATVGIGVGATPDYGAAQRMYVLRGYVPDGRGIAVSGETVGYGTQVGVDDLVLYLTKDLRPKTAPALVQ